MAVGAGFGLGVFHHHIGRGLVSIVVLSIAAAASYGLAAVLQHHAAVREPPELSIRVGLLVRLVRRPMWLVGNALDGVGYLFQFLALRRGSLPLVEPLLVLSLVFALPVTAWLDHRRISASDIASTVVVMAGLALFLGVAHPGLGHPDASGPAWVVLTAVTAVACGAMVLGTRGGSRRRAAVLLGAGSGTAFGYVAALTERTGHLLDAGVLHTLATWEPYALLVGGSAALLLTQSAFHAGALRFSLPTLTVTQPLVAVIIGLGLFGEHIDGRGLAPLGETIGLAMIVVGVFALTRVPVIGTDPDTP
ncbi:MAG TPA: DMT family transporter [Acidimicrobiales bacterium]|nr:DMT family transporter [Acidimicrobiales bacterium]